MCLVFGRDTTGLTNEELQKCDYNVSIITGSSYNTLNLSHAATIVFYELRRFYDRHHQIQSADKADTVDRRASRKQKERVVSLFGELAKQSDFQEYKQDKLRETVTRLLDRSDPSLRELYLLMGLASKAKSKIGNSSVLL
jgi:tRNA C32,U32 (ribose-2'-O)-methylase TrmJ